MTNARSLILRVLAAISIVHASSAFSCGGRDNPCKDDAFGCDEDPEELPVDDECTLTGPMEIELGWGEGRFHSFEEPFEIHYGVQGGQHMFAAVRIHNAEIDKYRRVNVRIRSYAALDAEACTSLITDLRSWALGDLPEDLRAGPFDVTPRVPMFVAYGEEDERIPAVGSSRCLTIGADREVSLGSESALRIADDGAIVEDSLLTFLDYASTNEYVFVAEAVDPCGRQAFVAASGHP